MKGIYKGFKYTLSQMFVVKDEEPEMEIGSPTDVKHLAHIGWDGPSGTAPSWMNEFKTGSDFAATSIGNSGSALSPWSSQGFGASSIRQQQESEMYKDICHADLPNIKKKQKRKKTKSTTSSPKSSSSTSRSARAKAKTNFVNGNANPTIEVEVA